jgi:urease accessory protein
MIGSLPVVGVPPLMVLLLTVGLWAEQLGGGSLWRVPLATLVGLGIGVLLANLPVAVPALGWLVPAAIVAVGVLVALAVSEPPGLAVGLAAVAAALHGRRFLAIPIEEAERILSTGLAALVTLAVGIGVGAMLGRGLTPKAVRVLGAAAAVYGVLLALGRI